MFHQSFYSQTPPPPLHNNRGPNHHNFMPTHSSFYPTSNQSSHHLNISRDFEQFHMPSHGFTSMPTGTYPFYDLTRWRQNMARIQQQYPRTPAYHFQDKPTFYYMSDPIITNDNRITIQLTKVHIGLNGDQQRVFVEQEFSNENELKKFVKNLRQNFEKTFNNGATGVHASNENIDENQDTKPGVFVVEEPDEEPKIYEQQVYNENIQSDIKSSSKFNDHEQYQRSSCSTIRSNKRRTNKMKYRRQNRDNPINKDQQNGKLPNYSRHYNRPPRFQQQENNFRIRTDFSVPPNHNSHWRFNGYSHHPFNNRSRSYIPPMNENRPPSRFHHPSTPPRFTRQKDQHKSQPSRTQQYRQNQPTIIAENLVFTNNKQQQTRVHRTRSDCRTKIPFRSQSKINQYLDYGPQQYFYPFYLPPTPIFYPQKRFFRNTQIQFRLFNPYRPNSNRF